MRDFINMCVCVRTKLGDRSIVGTLVKRHIPRDIPPPWRLERGYFEEKEIDAL